MLLVAILALASWWLLYRREMFRGLAAYHHAQALKHTTQGGPKPAGRRSVITFDITARGEWHKWLAWKYQGAASRPWLPVAPDPPPPLPGQQAVYDPDAEEDDPPRFVYWPDLVR